MAAADQEAAAWAAYARETAAASERLAMAAADAASAAWRVAEAAEEVLAEDRVLAAEAPAVSAPLYGMEAIMAGTAYTDGEENEDLVNNAGSA